MRSAILLLALGLASMPARAADVVANFGAVEVISLPERQHFGIYPFVGAAVVVPVRKVVLIPGLVLEGAPESGRWGFVASLVLDIPVHARLGIDVDVTVLHDQKGGDFGGAEFLLGGGVGFSVFADWLTISPFLNFFRDLSVP